MSLQKVLYYTPILETPKNSRKMCLKLSLLPAFRRIGAPLSGLVLRPQRPPRRWQTMHASHRAAIHYAAPMARAGRGGVHLGRGRRAKWVTLAGVRAPFR